MRKSNKVHDEGVPIKQKDERRASKRNFIRGTTTNSFAIFNSIDRDTLCDMARVSGIILEACCDKIDRNNETIVARELVQALLIEARERKDNKQSEGEKGEILVQDDKGKIKGFDSVIEEEEEEVVKNLELTCNNNEMLEDEKLSKSFGAAKKSGREKESKSCDCCVGM